MMDRVFSRDYDPVAKSDADGDSDATITSRPPRRGIQQFLKRNLAAITITGLLVILLLLAIAVITAIAVEPFRKVLVVKAPRVRYSCGNSTKEAEALGCAYDPLAGCWLHKECPHDFTDEFAHFNNGKPFVYFYDEAATQQMKDYTELGNNPDFYWTAVREHLVHCLYLLRRGH
ncbi:hypothetical protein N7519_002373 [Penicillium mononematosum]|uniref:uncharacterized protein n=1 Tax=Penicillium mononematosum TaxID=268346 RepID=UPI002546A2D2|nr:uncharacterized protein N7519_002373 [Penicillium mononematosum]KAJ6187465.1 hypothetical protein N7519_002373 [Penicillium mononematosum]